MDYLKILWRNNMKKSITNVNPKAKQTVKKQPSMLFIWFQFILTIALIIFGIITIFKSNLFIWFQLLLGVTLVDMGINNQLIYKRPHVTYAYIGIGLVILVLFVLKVVGI